MRLRILLILQQQNLELLKSLKNFNSATNESVAKSTAKYYSFLTIDRNIIKSKHSEKMQNENEAMMANRPASAFKTGTVRPKAAGQRDTHFDTGP